MFSLYSVMILWIDENVIKCDFTEISQKMDQLHKSRKSSEMVVRGWYRTHFDRRDFLKTKKISLGGFATFPTYMCWFAIFHDFFGNFVLRGWWVEKIFFQLSTPKFFFKNWFSSKPLFLVKLWYFSFILVYSLLAYCHLIKNAKFLNP